MFEVQTAPSLATGRALLPGLQTATLSVSSHRFSSACVCGGEKGGEELQLCGISCVRVCAQACLSLCNPMDCSPPGSSVRGIL